VRNPPRGIPAAAAIILSASLASAQQAPAFRSGAPGAFDFYVLALSWSPGFCALEGERKRREQCEPGRDLGFVLHGLWPQYERGYPADCGYRPLPAGALQEANGVFPDEGLARYEWRKHGACSGKSPAAYFRDARRARDQVRIPEEFVRPSAPRALRAVEIERAFAAENPGLRADMMAVVCRRGLLQEIRICFEKNLRAFRRCPEVARPECGLDPVRVDAAR
jgi:ribonuclease T2